MNLPDKHDYRSTRGQEIGDESMEEIKACPFCGNKDLYTGYNGGGANATSCGGHIVKCMSCCATSPLHPTEHAAIQFWNTRPQELKPLDEKSIQDIIHNHFLDTSDARRMWIVNAAKEIIARFGVKEQKG